MFCFICFYFLNRRTNCGMTINGMSVCEDRMHMEIAAFKINGIDELEALFKHQLLSHKPPVAEGASNG